MVAPATLTPEGIVNETKLLAKLIAFVLGIVKAINPPGPPEKLPVLETVTVCPGVLKEPPSPESFTLVNVKGTVQAPV